MRKAILVLGLLVLVVPSAMAFELGAAGIMDLGTASITQNSAPVTTTGASHFGFGAVAAFDVGPGFALETGVLYVPHGYTNTLLNKISLTMVEIPLLLKFNMLPIVSFGIGGFFDIAMGDVTSTTPGGVATTSTYSATSLNTTNFGLAAAVGASIPMLPMMHLFAEGRYLLGLSNMSSAAGTDLKLNDLQVLVGLKFGV